VTALNAVGGRLRERKDLLLCGVTIRLVNPSTFLVVANTQDLADSFGEHADLLRKISGSPTRSARAASAVRQRAALRPRSARLVG